MQKTRFAIRTVIAIGLLIAAALVPLRAAYACACCAEPGDRYEATETIDQDSRDLIAALRFGAKAQLYTTAADWEEQIKGIRNPAQSASYRLKTNRKGRRIVFGFADKSGNQGRLVFVVPKKVRKFQADPKPQLRTPDGDRTKLYKEWRLRTRGVSGRGMFTFRKSKKLLAQLIFHGEGNGCTFAEQFTHWTLDLQGPKTQFRFFGRLAKSK